MISLYILVYFVLIFLATLLVGAALLLGLLKIFKIKDATYGKSLAIAFVTGIVFSQSGNIFIGFGESHVILMIRVIITYITFHLMLKYYYKMPIQNIACIYVAYFTLLYGSLYFVRSFLSL
jgi:hypothetical protein